MGKKNILIIIGLLIVILGGLALYRYLFVGKSSGSEGMMEEKSARGVEVQMPVVAGAFYPSDPERLRGMVDDFIERASPPPIKGRVLGFMVPHAGYRYSGGVAGFVYRAVQGESYPLVVVMAPSHFVHFPGVSPLDKDYYQTPLGRVPLAREWIKRLIRSEEWISYRPEAYAREHSLEVQIPFLQRVLKGSRLVPIVMGEVHPNISKKLSEVLDRTFKGKKVLFLVSSDMSHYFTYEKAVAMDRYTLKLLEEGDIGRLYRNIRADRAQLCGLGPVMTLMDLWKRRGKGKIQVLKYANSGDVTGDMSRVVGYGSVAFLESRE